MQPTYSEFSNPKLVAIYNTVNPIVGYKDFYLNIAERHSCSKIIDIGCGTGLLSCAFAEKGYEVIGVEPSELMLNIARASKCGNDVKWVQGDATKLNTFNADLAIMTGHVAQFYLEDDYWLEGLKSINKALRSGGYLVFETRNPEIQPWANDKDHIDWPSEKDPRIVSDPTVGEVKWWMNLLKVKNEKALYENHYFFVKTGEKAVSTNELRFRTQDEIIESLKSGGFKINKIYGNWDESEVNPKSPEFIFLATKS